MLAGGIVVKQQNRQSELLALNGRGAERIPCPTISNMQFPLFAQELYKEYSCALQKKLLLQVGCLSLVRKHMS